MLTVALLLLAASPPGARADGAEDEQPYDGGLVLVADGAAGDAVHALAIQYFATGSPPVKWAASAVPIDVCTQQANRPAAIAADHFREVVSAAAAAWNGTEAAIGVRYAGDCAGQVALREGNRVNEIAWDDQRNQVRPPAAGVTQGRWIEFFGRREFTEADIILGNGLNVPDACLRSVVTHELGHLLGFGHSDRRGDLMYPSFNGSDISTCAAKPSTDEVSWLQALYGGNRAPAIAPAILQSVTAGALSQLSVNATDPEGDPLTYQWTQTAGPPVVFSASGPSASFTAPNVSTASLSFRVDVSDRYLHQTSTTLTATIAGVSAAPASTPDLEWVRPSTAGGRTVLHWSPVPEATFYRVCTTVDSTANRSCTDQPSSSVSVAWNTILGAGGDPATPRVLDSGTREVTMAACNGFGCTDFARPIHAGGATWGTWGTDFDVIGMAMDVPAAGFRFTVGGVFNVSGPARRFTLYAGTPDDPYQVRIQNCGSVEAGASCLGVLTPAQTGHLPIITATSDLEGTPTLEARVRIR